MKLFSSRDNHTALDLLSLLFYLPKRVHLIVKDHKLVAIWKTGAIRDAVVINGFTDTGIKCQIYPESNPDYVLSIEAKLMTIRYTFVPVLLLIFLPSIYAAGQKRAPRFEDYPARQTYKRKNHALILTRENRMFRTKLREAAGEKPNFAGHYIVAIWGCGTSCVTGAIIDAATGRVFSLPFSVCCWESTKDDFEPVEFDLNSTLIAFNGARAEKEGDVATHFYKFENDKLIFLKSVKAPG